jgi:hypothetical protein
MQLQQELTSLSNRFCIRIAKKLSALCGNAVMITMAEYGVLHCMLGLLKMTSPFDFQIAISY